MFQFQTHVSERYHLRWADSNPGIEYIEIRGHEEKYSELQDDSPFKIF